MVFVHRKLEFRHRKGKVDLIKKAGKIWMVRAENTDVKTEGTRG